MSQQFYVIRNKPAPGTPAEKAKLERDKAKGLKHGVGTEVSLEKETEAPPEVKPPPRQQPKKQTRSPRNKQTPGKTPSKKKRP
jgi:YidC/Oxa1 family membrane protein insertase